ncbi:acid-activated periplasmic chaperone HdeA [Commensalibacter papalotli (ex Botero et al. 2024)]|uniref:Acid stress chaperone HdeA n=1 Tax=Commensalibacter papalotli (ex Botero et al. 2024) TaxID=2972766 RepID=A0ABN8WAD2_9PROT|nr:acid-activated periplasmic chaperone HdeA [Commensalibacter papalotli (ex Botero et al. 2024)]CAI3941314.1 unnamed protein product [Commensalibacter papalotli (ex Botero et al. 2024)]CAI3949689.1 unnamed protein product [Commensalibacter papalotli (ex Botero et al. 2024)]
MIKPILFLAACILSIGTVTAANAIEKKQEVKPVGQLTCQDFLMLDDSFRPTAVAFAEGVTKKDKIVDPTLDVQGIAKVVPVLVQECKNTPKDNFVHKVKTHLNNKK